MLTFSRCYNNHVRQRYSCKMGISLWNFLSDLGTMEKNVHDAFQLSHLFCWWRKWWSYESCCGWDCISWNYIGSCTPGITYVMVEKYLVFFCFTRNFPSKYQILLTFIIFRFFCPPSICLRKDSHGIKKNKIFGCGCPSSPLFLPIVWYLLECFLVSWCAKREHFATGLIYLKH